MKKIAIITATRAEYGLLSPIIKQLRGYENENFITELIVTGTHVSPNYGNTINEIIADGFRIDEVISIPVESESEISISNNQATTLIEFTQLFVQKRYNSIVLLGDRYEMLSIAIAAGNTRTPIFHISGGDTTEGAIDEWIRHSITKMSYLHFTTNWQSRNRVIQMGENPSRVFNYGSTSIDNIINLSNLDYLEVLNSIGLENGPYAICTYHPVTMEKSDIELQVYNFLNALKMYPQITFIVTKSNSDQGGSKINSILDIEQTNIKNLHVFSSLGVRKYLSLMKHSLFVLGNSSSGIVETPAFHIPTINVGNRQRGRLQSDSIINCDSDTKSIVAAIRVALDDNFRTKCQKTVSVYGEGNAAEQIAKKMFEVVNSDLIDLKKKFYDISV